MNTEKTILIMDDDPYACSLLEDVMRGSGYVVEWAKNSAEAIVCLKQRRYEGIILDAWLELEQGESVLSWVKRQQRAEPVIMMSDTPSDDLWVDLINKGAADLIAKPFQPAQIKRTLRMAVEKKCMTPAVNSSDAVSGH
jgi:DNA-binding NtrC family response regulator